MIRTSALDDLPEMMRVYKQAFDDSESALVSDLAARLATTQTSPEIISLVAVHDDQIIGHVAYSPVWLVESKIHIGYILAPLAVAPDHQKRGVGSKLVEHGLNLLSDPGKVILVYGDPDYYCRFGFSQKTAKGFIPPYDLQFPHGWQARASGSLDAANFGAVQCVEPLMQKTLW